MVYTIEQIRQIVSPIAAAYGVRSMRLFGSYARGEATENSDLDILIDRGSIRSGFVLGGLCQDLRDSFKKELDMVTVLGAAKTFKHYCQPASRVTAQQAHTVNKSHFNTGRQIARRDMPSRVLCRLSGAASPDRRRSDTCPVVWKVRIVYAVQQDIRGHSPQLNAGNLHSGQLRFDKRGLRRAVKARHHHVAGNGQPLLLQGVHQVNRQIVVRAYKGVWNLTHLLQLRDEPVHIVVRRAVGGQNTGLFFILQADIFQPDLITHPALEKAPAVFFITDKSDAPGAEGRKPLRH